MIDRNFDLVTDLHYGQIVGKTYRRLRRICRYRGRRVVVPASASPSAVRWRAAGRLCPAKMYTIVRLIFKRDADVSIGLTVEASIGGAVVCGVTEAVVLFCCASV